MKPPYDIYRRYGPRGLRAVSRPRCPSAATTRERTLFGALNVRNGRRVLLRRARACAPDFQAFLRDLRQHYRAGQPLWLLLDKAPCHVAAGSLALAAELNITFLWLPRQCSELNAMDHLWRHLKNDLAANRQRPHIEALAQQAEPWTLALSPQQTLRKAGLLSKNCWLKHVRTNFWLPT
jgi:DDE superfamily endonuclease